MIPDRRPEIGRIAAVLLVTASVIFFQGAAFSAQTPVATVGVLTPGLTFEPVLEGLREGMARLGYRQGDNLRFQIEDAKGDLSALSSLANRLVDANPEVLFTVATAPSLAAKQATREIPIVFAGVAEPIHSGLIASFVSSGNNLTGVSAYTTYLSAKRLEVLKEIVPQTRKVLAIVSNQEVVSQISLTQLKEASSKMRVSVVHRDVTGAKDMETVLRDRWAGKVDAVFHLPSIFVERYMERLIAKACNERLPLIVHEDTLLKMGALVSYGGDFRSYGVQAAKLMDRVLKGARPMNIPVEVPDRLVLTINLAAAKALELKIPRAVLDRADRLVE